MANFSDTTLQRARAGYCASLGCSYEIGLDYMFFLAVQRMLVGNNNTGTAT